MASAAEAGLATGHSAGVGGFIGIGGSGGVVAAIFEAKSRRWARVGLLSGGAAALSALAGALAAGGRA